MFDIYLCVSCAEGGAAFQIKLAIYIVGFHAL